MKKLCVSNLALLWIIAPAAPAVTAELEQAPDVLFYSADEPELVLGDEATVVDTAEVAILDRYAQTYSTFHADGFTPCGTTDTAYFGGASYFRRSLGSLPEEDIDVDAFYVYPWGHIVFSTTREFTTARLGTVKDGSLVELDPFLRATDPGALRYVLREDELFADIELVSEQDVIFYSVTSTDGVVLGDGVTTLTKSEVAVAHATDVPALAEVAYTKAPDTIEPMYPNGFAVCGQQVVVRFGGDAFFEALGASDKVDVDAFYVLPSGHIAFSTASDFESTSLGTVKDGSVVEFDPYVPFESEASLRYLIDEELLFADPAGGADSNQDIDAFTIHQGKYYFSTAGRARVAGADGEPLEIGDSDIVEYDPTSERAALFVSAGAIFSAAPDEPVEADEIDIDGVSFDRRGAMIFSTREPAALANDFLLADGALGSYDPATGVTRVYALQSELFAGDQAAQADISAVHIEIGKHHGDCSPHRVDKGLVNNNQDIDGFTIGPDGTYYFSIEKDRAVLNGHSAAPLAIRDGDIIAYDIGTHRARVAHAESELFQQADDSPATDIDALALDASGNFVFSTLAPAAMLGDAANPLVVDDSSLVVWDAAARSPVLYADEAGELFGQEVGALANLDALHVMEAVDASCSPLPGFMP